MTWRIAISRPAQKQFDALDRRTHSRIAVALERLRADPFASPNVKLLTGQDTYRLRVGDYRIVFDLIGDELVILVLRIAHRREVYRGP